MRFIVAFCAIVSLCSAARADRIQIVGVVANYVTARDAVDIEIWLDRPLDMERETLLLRGGPEHVLGGSLGIDFYVQNGTRREPADEFSLLSRNYLTTPPELASTMLPDVAVEPKAMDGETRYVAAMSIAGDAIRLPEMQLNAGRFVYVANVYQDGGLIETVHGTSTVNAPRDTAVPEPSSVVLCLLGVVGVLGHRLVRRPRLRL